VIWNVKPSLIHPHAKWRRLKPRAGKVKRNRWKVEYHEEEMAETPNSMRRWLC
jgi:hypothetical protein